MSQDGGHSGGVNCVEWHPEESLLYSGSDDTNIIEWDLQTGKMRRSVYQLSLYGKIAESKKEL